MTVSVVQSVAFASPSSPSHGSPAPQSPSLAAGRRQVGQGGPGFAVDPAAGTEVVQQKLDQTSTSLAAALKAVERKLEDSDG